MLNLLNREHATSATHATDILRQGASAELAELAELEAIPEVGVTGLYSSRLLGVPANTDRTGVWIAHLDRTDGYTLTTAPQFAMNWPASTSPGQQVTAEQRFFNELASMSHLADAVRAAATLIGTARTAPDSSLIVQIGLTWQQSPTEFQTRYFHGHADEIATMTNDEISARWEVLPN
jgi:hypothetical protein